MASARTNPDILTLLCLAGVIAVPLLVFFIVHDLQIPGVWRLGMVPHLIQANVQAACILGPLAAAAWWCLARVTGWLWHRYDNFSVRLLMCTGALGLVVIAVTCDLVVSGLVRPLYRGNKPLTGNILSIRQPISVLDAQTRKLNRMRSEAGASEVSCPKCMARFLFFNDEPPELKCYTCGAPLTIARTHTGITAHLAAAG